MICMEILGGPRFFLQSPAEIQQIVWWRRATLEYRRKHGDIASVHCDILGYVFFYNIISSHPKSEAMKLFQIEDIVSSST